MKTYTFEQTVYYSDNYIRTLTLPNSITFCESTRYSDKQRFYFSVVKNPSEEMIALFHNSYTNSIVINNLLIGILSNVMPLCTIPEITIDEINNLYQEDLRKIYLVNKADNNNYLFYRTQFLQYCIFTDKDDELTIKNNKEEADKILEILNNIKPTYIESICRPIRFIKGGDKGPLIECDCVQFKSWLDIDKDIKSFSKEGISALKFDDRYGNVKSYVYVNEEAKPWKEMFENRIKEITKSAFE